MTLLLFSVLRLLVGLKKIDKGGLARTRGREILIDSEQIKIAKTLDPGRKRSPRDEADYYVVPLKSIERISVLNVDLSRYRSVIAYRIECKDRHLMVNVLQLAHSEELFVSAIDKLGFKPKKLDPVERLKQKT